MDFKFYFGVACFFYIVFCVQQGSSLMCYECSTKNDDQEDCLNITTASTKYLHNCTAPKDQSCRMQIQWIDFDFLNTVRDKHVIRTCASSQYNPETECFYRTGNLGRMSVCNCQGDGCNEASRSTTTFFATCLLLFIVKLLL